MIGRPIFDYPPDRRAPEGEGCTTCGIVLEADAIGSYCSPECSEWSDRCEEPMKRRSPLFEPQSTDWAVVDRTMDLKHELALKAIAWVHADRICDDLAAALTRIEDEADTHLSKGQEPNEHDRALLGKLEYEKIGFRLADQRAQRYDEAFRQAAQKLVDALERGDGSPRIGPKIDP